MTDNFFGITDLGKQRQNNEDTFIAQQNAGGRYIIACVIDGVGGYAGGEVAAEIARETIIKRLDKLSPNGADVSSGIMQSLIDAFNIANEKIWQEKHAVKEHKNMACVITLAVVDISSNQFYYAHLGDTRLYLLRDGSLVKISRDQSFVGFLEDSGRLTEKEAMQHPKRNEINKALGFKATLDTGEEDINTGQSPFLPGDMLLLCSDGLTDVVNKAGITEILTASSSLKTIGTQLIDAANHGGGKDNITVVLVKNDKSSQQHPATKPIESAQPTPVQAASTREKAPMVAPTKSSVAAPVKKNTGLIVLLIVLVIGLAAVCIWQYLNYNSGKSTDSNQVVETPAPAPVKKARNVQEVKLQQLIDGTKGKLVVLSDTAFKSPVLISQSININRDSLHIQAKGHITFKSDSGFSEPAFVLSSKIKNLVLDSLAFQDFGVAISGFNQLLQLKNVQFSNCKIPLQNVFGLAADKYISGSVIPSSFKTDSLPKAPAIAKTPKKHKK